MDTQILLARVKDAAKMCLLDNKPKFLGFLSKEESVLVEKYLQNQAVNYIFFGGHPLSERVYLCCCPEWLDNPPFPVSAVTFSFRKQDHLTHRDFWGSLMALGITRESVGDILIEQGRAVVFLNRDIEAFVLKNLQKVGRIGVSLTSGYELPLPSVAAKTEKSVTVASLRLDCVVSAIANFSRNNATECIENGLVFINSVMCEKTTKIISCGDVISVRHKGKFQILSCENKTKKDRTVIHFNCF